MCELLRSVCVADCCDVLGMTEQMLTAKISLPPPSFYLYLPLSTPQLYVFLSSVIILASTLKTVSRHLLFFSPPLCYNFSPTYVCLICLFLIHFPLCQELFFISFLLSNSTSHPHTHIYWLPCFSPFSPPNELESPFSML